MTAATSTDQFTNAFQTMGRRDYRPEAAGDVLTLTSHCEGGWGGCRGDRDEFCPDHRREAARVLHRISERFFAPARSEGEVPASPSYGCARSLGFRPISAEEMAKRVAAFFLISEAAELRGLGQCDWCTIATSRAPTVARFRDEDDELRYPMAVGQYCCGRCEALDWTDGLPYESAGSCDIYDAVLNAHCDCWEALDGYRYAALGWAGIEIQDGKDAD